jgi:hypothetical protein
MSDQKKQSEQSNNPNITVNNNSTGNNFNPTPYPSNGSVAAGSWIAFRAAGNTSISFYAYQMNNGTVVNAFTGNTSPATAPASSSDPQSYHLKPHLTGAVTLSLSDPNNPTISAGMNGTINVGNGGGDPL